MNKKIFGIALLSVIGVMFVAAILINMQIVQPIVQQPTITVKQGKWETLPPLGDPAGDASGFCGFWAYAHSATPNVTYASNLTEAAGGNVYEYRGTLNGEADGETPFNTAYDYIVKFRVNDTVGYNVSGSKWEKDWVRVNLTIDFDYATDVGPLQGCNIVEIANNSDFCWYAAYLQDTDGGLGAGFQITHGETWNATAVQIQVYK